jgi:hypothetical protein
VGEGDGTNYGKDFTHGFDTQNYPKLQDSLGTQPENTHGIQRQTQPNPYPNFGSGPGITLGYPNFGYPILAIVQSFILLQA